MENTARIEVIDLDNLPPEEGEYILIPRGLLGKKRGNGNKFTPCIVMVGATINSYSGRDTGDGKLSHCRRRYEDFNKELNFCNTTISVALEELNGAGYIKKSERSVYDFQRDVIPVNRYYRVEIDFIRKFLKIKHEGIRQLTPAEVLVFAYFYTYCRNEKTKKNEKYASILDIALELELSERTVWKAIRTLLRAGLIHRTKEDKGVNRHKRSRYTLDSRLVNRRRRKKKNAAEPKKKDGATSAKEKQVQDFNERVDIERWYASRRNAAESKADNNLRRARADAKFKAIECDIKETDREMAKAEVFNLPTLSALKEKAKGLHLRQAKILKGLGLTMADFEPETFAICRKCFDTGFTAEGRACNCYQRE